MNKTPPAQPQLSATPERMSRLTSIFWSRVNGNYATDDCWQWIGSRSGDGYGTIQISRKRVGAHRFSWTLWRGEIPKGMCVLHRCDNPICVRPEHLFLGTKLDNRRDAMAKGRIPTKTHCWRGHELTEENIYARKKNQGRQCKLCARIRNRKII